MAVQINVKAFREKYVNNDRPSLLMNHNKAHQVTRFRACALSHTKQKKMIELS